MNQAEIIKNIEFQTKNDPRDRRHSITFLYLNGTLKTFPKCIFISSANNIFEWLDENDVHHLTPISNCYDIFFDKIHRKLVEEFEQSKDTK